MSKLAKALTAATGNAGSDPLYVEDVFSTYVYAGNSTAGRAIVNGIDLSGEGGMVWHKRRTGTGSNHALYDTERGATKNLRSNQTNAESTSTGGLTSFNSNGFTYGTYQETGYDYASWTFRKAEKFFDVVTYTGDGVTGRTVAHNLGSTPSCIIIKRTDSAKNWTVYHSGLNGGSSPESYSIHLNLSEAQGAYGAAIWNSTAPSGSVFTLGSSDLVNASGGSYVAYVFASDAGGFGDDGDENIIKCGSFTTNGSGNAVVSNLGFEPSWLMIKKSAGGSSNWEIRDDMRGFGPGASADLKANESDAESSPEVNKVFATATGFEANVGSNSDYIYIAIRRPMKTPESGTEIFSPYAYSDTNLTSGSGTASNRTIINGGSNGGSGFAVDQFWHQKTSSNSSYGFHIFDRLRGKGQALITNHYNASPAGDSASNGGFDFQEGVDVEYNGEMYYYNTAAGSRSHISYCFKRASKAFDTVIYDGNGTAGRTVTHNLQAVPEMMFVKAYSTSNDAHWVYHKATGNTASLLVNGDGSGYGGYWNSTTPSATTFTLSSSAAVNSGSYKYVAWLWATLDGVTKVGSYSGTGSDVNVDCGFSAGARFILIKRSNGDGDWYVWDSARGIIAGNDPYVIFEGGTNTSTDYIDPLSSGFTVTSSAPAALNASGGTYIFLAIAQELLWNFVFKQLAS